ncbi:hypothetical protein BH11ARM1_BH11ARM1_12970 [soil metagenome]
MKPKPSQPTSSSAKPSSHLLIVVLLIAVLIGNFVISAKFASETPWRTGGVVLSMGHAPAKDIGAPDERQHANYIRNLANGEGFPVFNPTDPNLYESYQSHQPPAFYVLATGYSRLLALDLQSSLDSNDTGFKLRLLNCFVGVFAVLGIYFLGSWGFTPGVGLAAAAFAGFLPMFCALCGSVGNDPMLVALCSWVLAFCALGIKQGWNWKIALAAGILTGIAILTKSSAIGLLPVLLVAALLPQTKKPSLSMAACTAIIALAIAGPWLARNQRLYGDPLAAKAFTQAFKGSAQKEMIVGVISAPGNTNPEMTSWKDWVGWWTARSFVGAFGYMDIWMNESGLANRETDKNTLYRLMLVGLGIAALGWVLSFGKPEYRKDWAVQMINGVFLLIILASFVRFNMQYFQAQARYLLPALGPLACGFGIGLNVLLKNRSVLVFAILAIALVGIDVYALNMLPDQFKARVTSASAP